MIYINEEALPLAHCEKILDIFWSIPEVIVDEANENHFWPSAKEYNEMSDEYWLENSWKYQHPQGRMHATVNGHKRKIVYEMVEGHLPHHFAELSYMQIIRYPENSFMEWHLDTGDSEDEGTAMVFLNDNYLGGNLNVSGHRLITKQGTVVAFEDSTENFHGVEPIYKGERYCLAMWFHKV